MDDGAGAAVIGRRLEIVVALHLRSVVAAEDCAMRKSDRLIERYIEPDPYRPGPGEARLKDFGVPVWALVGHMNAVHGRVAQVAEDYNLPVEAVEAALEYYRRHQATIDARLEANAAHFV